MISGTLKFLTKTVACAGVAAALSNMSVHAADTVILLHGLGRSPLAMARLESDLKRSGYIVRNLAYPSQRDDIRTLADATLGPIFAVNIPAGSANNDSASTDNTRDAATAPAAPVNTSAPRIHIVTHSLGGILVRQYLHDHGTPAQLGRVVMIAPPNAGSEVVDHMRSYAIYRRINGPAGLQLGTDAGSVPRALGALPESVEVGVIAGDRTLNPLFSAWISGVDDGKVSIASSHVAGESDHVTMPYSHTWLMWRAPVLAEVRAFLREGHFTTPNPS